MWRQVKDKYGNECGKESSKGSLASVSDMSTKCSHAHRRRHHAHVLLRHLLTRPKALHAHHPAPGAGPLVRRRCAGAHYR